MARGAVDVDRCHFVQDERTGILLKCRRHLHSVRGDPVQRHLFLQVCHLLDIHGLGDALVGVIGNALERDNPGDMAQAIVDEAVSRNKGTVSDDMSVIVAGVWEN